MHSRATVLYCKDCMSALCNRCAPSHSGHDIWPLEACEDIYDRLLAQATQALTLHNEQVKALKAQLKLQNTLEERLESWFEAQLVGIKRAKFAEMESLKRKLGKMQGELEMYTTATRNCLKTVNSQILAEAKQREMVKTRVNALKAKIVAEGTDLRAAFREIQALQQGTRVSELPEIPHITLFKPDWSICQQVEDNWSLEEMRFYRIRCKTSSELGN